MMEPPKGKPSDWKKTLRAGAAATIITALAGLVHEAGVVFDHYIDVQEQHYEFDHSAHSPLPPFRDERK